MSWVVSPGIIGRQTRPQPQRHCYIHTFPFSCWQRGVSYNPRQFWWRLKKAGGGGSPLKAAETGRAPSWESPPHCRTALSATVSTRCISEPQTGDFKLSLLVTPCTCPRSLYTACLRECHPFCLEIPTHTSLPCKLTHPSSPVQMSNTSPANFSGKPFLQWTWSLLLCLLPEYC